MSAYNNNFMRKGNSALPSLSTFVVIHEQAEQLIQGGSSNEHYHLTQAQLTNVVSIPNVVSSIGRLETMINTLPVYQPMMASDGTLVLIGAGDLMMAKG